ncbi:hypothetical protein [Enterococcus timonensis]|uniref:hypothetical protein n=1 Tax=Enterococcus timonensis TaxID=1852364 RepID=UPI0008DAF71F|nr:hypothetical protein [Enterococcus timonensis]
MKKINALLSNQQHPDDFLKSFAELPDELLIFPSWLPRFKYFTEKTPKQIDTVIDFPLGNGTLAKKSFELAQACEQGIETAYVMVTPRFLQIEDFTQLAEEMNLLQGVSAGRCLLSFLIDLSQLKEGAKLDFADWLKTQTFHNLTFFINEELTENDLAIFHFAIGETVNLQLLGDVSKLTDPEILERYEIAAIISDLA